MKKYIVYFLTCVIAGFSLASCDLGGDDDDLTTEEIDQIILNLSGNHYGTFVTSYDYIDSESKFANNDTTYTYVTFDLDTTVTIYQLPVKIIADKIQSSTSTALELKDSLASKNTVNAYGKYIPLGVSPLAAMIYSINFPLAFGDTTHTITLSLLAYYSFVQVESSKMTMQLIPGAIYVDDEMVDSFPANSNNNVDLIYAFYSSD